MFETVKEWLREYWYLPIIALAALAVWWWQANAGPVTPATPVTQTDQPIAVTASSASAASSSRPKRGYVYVTGAVVRPGMYPIDANTRWDAVVAAAGGLTPEADRDQLNLAKIASDEERLHVPAKGEALPTESTAGGITNGGMTANDAGGAGLVNLNTATEAELQTLSGIGPKRAADIVAFRTQNGGFKQVEDLKQVSGIGEKIFAALAPLVTVGP